MRYVEYRDAIERALRGSAAGMTWAQLRQRLRLPYDRPCPAWTRQLEQDIGLTRSNSDGGGRALVWKCGGRRRARA